MYVYIGKYISSVVFIWKKIYISFTSANERRYFYVTKVNSIGLMLLTTDVYEPLALSPWEFAHGRSFVLRLIDYNSEWVHVYIYCATLCRDHEKRCSFMKECAEKDRSHHSRCFRLLVAIHWRFKLRLFVCSVSLSLSRAGQQLTLSPTIYALICIYVWCEEINSYSKEGDQRKVLRSQLNGSD